MSGLADLVLIFVNVMQAFFNMLDTFMIGEYSVLDLIVGGGFFGITVWFLGRMLGNKKEGSNKE